MTMFKGSKRILPEEGADPIVDHDVIIDYLASLDDTVSEEYQEFLTDKAGSIWIVGTVEENAQEAQQTPEPAEETETESETGDEMEGLTEAEVKQPVRRKAKRMRRQKRKAKL